MQRKKNGQVLIIVVSILMLMSMLGVSFVSNASLNRQAASNSIQAVESRFALNAGMEVALCRLYDCFRQDSWYTTLPGDIVIPVWHYRGEDINGDGIRGATSTGKEEDRTLAGEADVDEDNTLHCRLSQALAPSFWDGVSKYASGPLANRGYNGGFRLPNGNATYALQVDDLSGKIAVLQPFGITGEVPDWGGDGPNIVGTARMLSNLVRLVRDQFVQEQRSPATGTSKPPDSYWASLPADINEAIQQQPGDKFSQQADLWAITDNPVVQSILSQYLTTYAWIDPNTIQPPTGGDIIPANLASGDKLSQPLRYKKIELAPRAPININSAPWEVLVSCLCGIKGREVRPGFLEGDGIKDLIPHTYFEGDPATNDDDSVSLPNGSIQNQGDRIGFVTIEPATAKMVADEILMWRRRTPFTSWKEFAKFLAWLIKYNNLEPQQASLIWANANPNTSLNKFNPDFPDQLLLQAWSQRVYGTNIKKVPYYRIDKSDLEVYTTEFCFYPTGYFQITALGRIVGESGVMAEATQTTVVKLFDIYRQTTQAELENNMDTVASQGVCTYPEVTSSAKSQCHYDGYLSLTPQNISLAGINDVTAVDVPGISQWGNIQNIPLVPLQQDQSPGNVFNDGVWADTPSNDNPSDGILANNPLSGVTVPPDKNTLLCFWYKPGWNVLDPYCRPHSVMDANDPWNNDQVFQVFNESRVFQNDGDTARWTVAVWDASALVKLSSIPKPSPINPGQIRLAMDGPGGIPLQPAAAITQIPDSTDWKIKDRDANNNPLHEYVLKDNPQDSNVFDIFIKGGFYQLAIDMPDKVSQNRWLFFALSWGNSGLSVSVNEAEKTMKAEGVSVPLIGHHLEDWVDANGNFHKGLRSTATEVITNMNNTLDEARAAAQTTFTVTTSLIVTVPSKPDLTLASNDLNELLEYIFSPAISIPDGPDGYVKQGVTLSVGSNYAVDSVETLNNINQYVQDRLPDYAARSVESVWYDSFHIDLSTQGKVDTFVNRQVVITMDAPKVHLGGPVKYLKSAEPPVLMQLPSPSYGTYADVRILTLDQTVDHKNLAIGQLYPQGRYAKAGTYVSNPISLLPAGSKPPHIGGLRYTAYLAKDCPDLQDAGYSDQIEVVLCDGSGTELKTLSTEASAVNLDLTSTSLVYKVKFTLQQDQPVLAAPMFDDLTLTYSNGWKIVETRMAN